MTNKHKLYILSFDGVFTWKHFFAKPLKWVIKGSTGSDINHMAYSYTYAKQGEEIKEAVGEGFHSIFYKKKIEGMHSKIWAHEVKVPIDFKLTHKMTKEHYGDKYEPEEAVNSAFDRIPIFNKVYRFFARIKKNDKDFSYCSKAIVMILKANGHLLDVKDNSLNPGELKKRMKKDQLCHPPVLVWNKNHYVNNIFNQE